MPSLLSRLLEKKPSRGPQARPGQPVVERRPAPTRLSKFYGSILKALGRAVEPKQPQGIPITSPELARSLRQIAPEDAAYANYLYFEEWLPVSSSNVKRIRYFYERRLLGIEFIQHGSYYEYPEIGPQTALEFAKANSPGKWTWDELRTPNRPYYFVSSADGHVPRRIGWQALSRKSLRRIVAKLRAQPGVKKRAKQFDFEARFKQRFDPGRK